MINVVLKKGSDYVAFKALLDNAAYTYTQHGSGRIFCVEADHFALTDHPDVLSAKPPVILNLKPSFSERVLPITHYNATNDTITADAWGLARICRRNNPFISVKNGFAANPSVKSYAYTRTGVGVDCYLIDVGINPNHQEFGGRLRWVSNNSNTDIDTANSHGTAVASNMAGANTGPASGSDIWYVQSPNFILNDSEYITLYDQALQHYLSRSATNRPAVINHSFGGDENMPEPSEALYAMIDDVLDAGIIICAASGNYGNNLDTSWQSPAETDLDVVVVGAATALDSLMDYTSTAASITVRSGTGDNVDIYAPGMQVSCAYSDSSNSYAADEYALYNGTSMASPYVAGAIACMLEGYQRLTTREQVRAVHKRLIDNSTKDKIRIDPTGKGIIHNRLLYLDPRKTIEGIPELNPL